MKSNEIVINEITAAEEKSTICNNVLQALPNWFGIPESITDYVAGVQEKPFYGIFDGDIAIGFVSIKVHNPYTAEIYVMGILDAYHRQGLGKKIVAACEEYCHSNNMEFLTVKTLDEKNPDIFYKQTRLFYQAMGFIPLEVFPLLWDESNPCLFMAKYVGNRK